MGKMIEFNHGDFRMTEKLWDSGVLYTASTSLPISREENTPQNLNTGFF